MKKFLLFVLALSILCACSSHKLFGTWYVHGDPELMAFRISNDKIQILSNGVVDSETDVLEITGDTIRTTAGDIYYSFKDSTLLLEIDGGYKLYLEKVK